MFEFITGNFLHFLSFLTLLYFTIFNYPIFFFLKNTTQSLKITQQIYLRKTKVEVPFKIQTKY